MWSYQQQMIDEWTQLAYGVDCIVYLTRVGELFNHYVEVLVKLKESWSR